MDMLEKQSGLLCQGRKVGELGPKQRSRKLKVLKERAECALWFAKSFGLELAFVKLRDAKAGQSYSFNYDSPPYL